MFTCLIFPILLFERRRLRKARAAFAATRQAMPDDVLLSGLGAELGFAPFFLIARQAMAGLCVVDAELIHPDDSMRCLMNFQWDNGYIHDFLFLIEAELGVKLRLDRLGRDEQALQFDDLKFGAFLTRLLPYCEPLTRTRCG